jgi:hypothetical protein
MTHLYLVRHIGRLLITSSPIPGDEIIATGPVSDHETIRNEWDTGGCTLEVIPFGVDYAHAVRRLLTRRARIEVLTRERDDAAYVRGVPAKPLRRSPCSS